MFGVDIEFALSVKSHERCVVNFCAIQWIYHVCGVFKCFFTALERIFMAGRIRDCIVMKICYEPALEDFTCRFLRVKEKTKVR